ncbi:hypothetical protein N825_25010 [Skermanella stibiiresistens SB22]|uniref:VapC45 PIN like domain-containing protein n=1 Tax=Skermanella stibiiresistens SB22 TaxID=1385369 RepID=W9H749_9PROT|nr:hypothetical protein [Skermanella stibiiresistens]EWY41864.1 hypothetical protein N825_25010 [Skermanella stibiiresistens SB22]
MNFLLDEFLPQDLASGLTPILRSRFSKDVISHVNVEYFAERSREDWKRKAKEHGWSILSGDHQFKDNSAKIASWRSLGFPVVICTTEVMRICLHQRAAMLLYRWESIRDALMKPDLHVFDGKKVVEFSEPPPKPLKREPRATPVETTSTHEAPQTAPVGLTGTEEPPFELEPSSR